MCVGKVPNCKGYVLLQDSAPRDKYASSNHLLKGEHPRYIHKRVGFEHYNPRHTFYSCDLNIIALPCQKEHLKEFFKLRKVNTI